MCTFYFQVQGLAAGSMRWYFDESCHSNRDLVVDLPKVVFFTVKNNLRGVIDCPMTMSAVTADVEHRPIRFIFFADWLGDSEQ